MCFEHIIVPAVFSCRVASCGFCAVSLRAGCNCVRARDPGTGRVGRHEGCRPPGPGSRAEVLGPGPRGSAMGAAVAARPPVWERCQWRPGKVATSQAGRWGFRGQPTHAPAAHAPPAPFREQRRRMFSRIFFFAFSVVGVLLLYAWRRGAVVLVAGFRRQSARAWVRVPLLRHPKGIT